MRWGACSVSICEDGFRDCDMDATTGCEADVTSSIEHCGQCGNSCDVANASTSCVNGACELDTCDAGFADCDMDLTANGCEANTQTSLDHCGGCDQPCAIPNAQVECASGSCTFNGCASDYHDLNNDLSDGCEYYCVFQSMDDAPDPQYVDANCDGIDGDAARAVFVSAQAGSDANSGSRAAPYKTIGKALNTARNSGGVDQILLDVGVYNEQLFLVKGVTLAGGYERTVGWSRSQFAVPTIQWSTIAQNRIVTVFGINLTTPTLVEQVKIESGSTTSNGVDVYGMHCDRCSGLTLRRVEIVAGDAGDGPPGTDGLDGDNGGTGGNGGAGDEDGSRRGFGGQAGASNCRRGGAGGIGGSKGSNRGANGLTGEVGTPGGAGGGGGNPGADGGNGFDGNAGFDGSGWRRRRWR